MERDELKRFISDHREEFDGEKAPLRAWDAIENELHKPNPFKKYGLLSLIILGMAGLFIGGMYFGQQKNKSKDELTPTMFANAQPKVQYNMPQEVVELENYYNTIIADKKSSVKLVSNNSPIEEELQVLDNSYEELKNEFISKNADEDLLIHLMIENYKLRIKLLEMTLQKSQKNKQIHINDNKYERNEY